MAAQWDELLRSFSHSSVFQTRVWLDYLSRARGVRAELLGIYAGRELAGCFPLVTKKMWGARVVGSPIRGWGVPHMGPAYAPGMSPTAVGAAVTSYLSRVGYNYFEMKTLGRTVDLKPWGFRPRSMVNFTIDLRDGADKIWQRFQGRARTSVRKAEKSGVVVRLERGSGFLKWYHRMLKDTFHRNGARCAESVEQLRVICELSEAADQRLVLSAWVRGVPVAGAVFVHANWEMAYWSGASDARLNWTCANSAIQWEAIQRACARGLTLYSMGGGQAEGGAGRFKAGFGAQGTELQLWSRARNKLLSGAVGLYERMNTGLTRR